MKNGFTLSEVLITLGIIGVVAAMTIPPVIQNHKKHVVETKLKKVYSTINQAIKLSEVTFGDVQTWDRDIENTNIDGVYNWFNKYIGSSISGYTSEKVNNGILVKLSDGTALMMYSTGSRLSPHIVFCTEYKYCKKSLSDYNNSISIANIIDGKNLFLFYIPLIDGFDRFGEFAPYYYPLENKKTEDILLNGNGANNPDNSCAGKYKYYCAGLIEYNGWKIPKNYPVRF